MRDAVTSFFTYKHCSFLFGTSTKHINPKISNNSRLEKFSIELFHESFPKQRRFNLIFNHKHPPYGEQSFPKRKL